MRDWTAVVREEIGPLDLDPARAAEIIEEFAQHVSQEHAELVSAGLTDDAAYERAIAPLRGRARLAVDIVRADRPRLSAPPPAVFMPWWASLAVDAVHACRQLRRTPGFALVIVLTVALGIGATTAIFSVIDAVLLRPLPYATGDRLVAMGEADRDNDEPSTSGFATILDWRERLHSVEQIAIIRDWSAVLISNDRAERINGLKVSWNFFTMLGVQPAIGRDFRRGEDTQNDWRVVVLSDRLWRTRFGADPNIAGKPITMNGRQYLTIGVMPAAFEPLISEHYYKPADLWTLLGYDLTLPYACRSCQHLRAIGLLRPGTTLDQARAELQAVEDQLQRAHPADYTTGTRMAVARVSDLSTGGMRRILGVLMAAVLCVLLIACANVANVLLARVSGRERDLRVRIALGASRARIAQYVLLESLILGMAAAIVAIVVATWTVPLLSALSPAPMQRLTRAHVNGPVLLFSLAVAVLTSLAFGVVPAVRASRVDLRAAARGASAQAPATWGRRLLIGVNVALAVVLLAAAGVMIRSVGKLVAVDPGFDPFHVLTLQAEFFGTRFAEDEKLLAAQREVMERLRTLPGVTTVAAAGQIPFDGNADNWGFHIEGRMRGRDGADDPSLERFGVTPEYFQVLHIPLLRGRLITPADDATGERVVVVNERAARELWPHADPIGTRVRIGDATKGPWRTVVGVVGDVKHRSLSAPVPLQMYVPQPQFTDAQLTFLVRTTGDPAALMGPARQAVHAAVADAPVERCEPLTGLVARGIAPQRFVMVLLSIFSIVALALTAVGVYGVISYSVTERTREIGIRAALGASRARIICLVLGGGMTVVLGGVVVGLTVSLKSNEILGTSLYQVSPRDPMTLLMIVGVLVGVALAAHAAPVLRALRVSPTTALRQE